MQAATPEDADEPDPFVPPPEYPFFPTPRRRQFQLAAGLLATLAGTFVAGALPVHLFLLSSFGILFPESAGGVLVCMAWLHLVLSVVVIRSAVYAYRGRLETGLGLVMEGVACVVLSLLFLGGILALLAGVLLLIAGSLAFAS